MIDCTSCGAASDLYLCPRCIESTEYVLTGLAVGQDLGGGRHGAAWLGYLADAAVGDTRLGESSRRSSDYTTPMPMNLRASALLDEITAFLGHWVAVINTHAETLGESHD